jgi:hypothetical protein
LGQYFKLKVKILCTLTTGRYLHGGGIYSRVSLCGYLHGDPDRSCGFAFHIKGGGIIQGISGQVYGIVIGIATAAAIGKFIREDIPYKPGIGNFRGELLALFRDKFGKCTFDLWYGILDPQNQLCGYPFPLPCRAFPLVDPGKSGESAFHIPYINGTHGGMQSGYNCLPFGAGIGTGIFRFRVCFEGIRGLLILIARCEQKQEKGKGTGKDEPP